VDPSDGHQQEDPNASRRIGECLYGAVDIVKVPAITGSGRFELSAD
jgi:hypothetical protein